MERPTNDTVGIEEKVSLRDILEHNLHNFKNMLNVTD